MTVEELIKKEIFQVIEEGEDLSRKVTKVFCCDLLSVAMGRAPSDSAWDDDLKNDEITKKREK